MYPRAASTSSSTSHPGREGQPSSLLDKILPLDTVYETLTTLRAPGTTHTTPLGLRREAGGRLSILIYPGARRLHTVAPEAYEACITLPQTPIPFFKALLGEPVDVEKPAAISTPCPAGIQARIEAVITSRRRVGEYIRLTVEPVHVEAGTPIGYTRLHGASIELLVAYSRVAHWASVRACRPAEENYALMLQASRLIERLDYSGAAKRYVSLLLSRAEELLVSAGCSPVDPKSQ